MEQAGAQKKNCGFAPEGGIRKAYMLRLVLRVMVFLLCVWVCFYRPEWLGVLQGWNFFTQFSPLHLLWGVWVADMVLQLVPVKKHIPLGSQKLFKQRFRPIREKVNREALLSYVRTTTKAAYLVFLLWLALLAAIAALYYSGVIQDTGLFMISVAFYVCDLICVLIWCPFRLILKNRCCTTCRIFNWDHLMMFSPMAFVGSFFSWSLFLIALAVWAVWELFVLLFPERFWEHSNEALQCASCTDKLCTQYCRKLRD